MFDLTPIDCQPANPGRPLDWRWRMASWATRGGRWGAKRPDDPWRRRAIALARSARSLPPPTRSRSGRPDPDGLQALRIHGRFLAPDRLALEARLLAGQGDAAIAARTGLGEGAIAAYAALFFDVRPILGRPDAVMALAIGRRAYDEDGGGPAVALRLLAYRGGPHVVDALLGPAPGGPGLMVDGGAGLDPGLAEDLGLMMAALALPASGRDAAKILRLYDLVERAVRAEVDGDADAGFGPAPLPAMHHPAALPPARPIAAAPDPAPRAAARGDRDLAPGGRLAPGVPARGPRPDPDRAYLPAAG